MELPVDTQTAIPGLPFGSPKEAVRAYFRGQPQPFKRTPSCNEADYWPRLGTFAYYDSGERLEALELGAEAFPTLSGQTLTSLSLEQAQQLLRALDAEVEVDADGVTSTHLGLALWSGEGLHGLVKSVLRFGPGYYD